MGSASRQRDLLIEHLHRIQDHFGYLSVAHVAALARKMRRAQVEIYEVASFYHHFDGVKEGEEVPQALRVRVVLKPVLEMASAAELLGKLTTILGCEVRIVSAPYV